MPPNRIIVMTGATAGIGQAAARLLAEEPDTHLIIGARGTGRQVPEGSEVLPLDLASLDSVRSFADAVTQRLGERRIDTLVLNAGLNSPDPARRTEDGFGVTFAVNHLAHYLLARLLLPVIADGGRLIITASDTHDPKIIPVVGPTTLDPEALAHPSAKPGRMRAYAASKLCNVLTARSLAVLDDVTERGITVVAYNPGLTPDTGLAGDVPAAARTALRVAVLPVLRLVSRFRPAFYPGTVERAGQVLAELTLGTTSPPTPRVYVSLVRAQVTFPAPSELALDDNARDLLWRESATMTGLAA
ncbi:SDR family NAD(P)-dependent oxidoreductase [Pseudonocardia spinosispora]|uniref:SDR family NAD(P)-dependent oxidoreductase n=1 Tax=Pseudonocardia spinosispora TaxID=103441 RepID=UPI0004283127|nr:SDR family NAD(P)-dependent oxidoreductase [Pseudonocardia spinosispora]